MKTVLLAMTEDQHDKRSWSCTAWVAVTLTLTLALSASTREQAALVRQIYNDTNNTALLLFTAAVTVGQVLTAALLLRGETSRSELPNREAIAIILFSQAGVSFLHDFLAALGDYHNSLPAAFAQPLQALLVLWVVTSVRPSIHSWSSILVITSGCICISIRGSTIFSSDRTSLISFLFSMALILRNIVIRQLVKNENVTVKSCSSLFLSCCVTAWTLFMVGIYLTVSSIWLAPMFCALGTCAISTALLYSVTQVLKSFSVTFVSLFNLWALLIEALILTPFEHRPDVVVSVTALLVVLVGHYLFLKDHIDNCSSNNTLGTVTHTYNPKPVNTHEQYTRIEFLLFFCSVMGVIFYVFQPQVSQRDLKTLSYVGLDRIIRRLLMVQELEAE